jgi:hypothetical protein
MGKNLFIRVTCNDTVSSSDAILDREKWRNGQEL